MAGKLGPTLARPAVALLAAAAMLTPAAAPSAAAPASPAPAAKAGPTHLYLVTLVGPGAADDDRLPGPLARFRAHQQQTNALAAVGAPAPVYRWTTALNGVAVRLTARQADELAAQPGVALVERDRVHRLAAAERVATQPQPRARTRGGAGVVVGVVDTGIDPDSPLFSDAPGLGRRPADFDGDCQPGEQFSTSSCDAKLVSARWYAAGFGEERVRSTDALSVRDDHGHGTQVASLAAGNPGLTVRVAGRRYGRFSGTAPQARVAAYKACWTAPDPADDGCSTADLVSAVDDAVADGVDVLTLAVSASGELDTLQRALLGAAESDVVVVAAAGNAGARRFAGHPSPWVTTVGAATRARRLGRVTAPGLTLTGASAARAAVGPARLVVGADAPAPGAQRDDARICAPGSLDAARVAGAVVLCERGQVGRVDKSAAVHRADGVGMVLANVGPGSTYPDFHSVPTVHLDRSGAERLRSWLAEHPAGRVRVEPAGRQRSVPGVAPWSSGGDPAASVVKPDLVAGGVGVVAAVPARVRADRWDVLTGTSAAAARVAGAAALIRSRHPDWPATTVRSALVGSAGRVRATSVLRSGAGSVNAARANRPGLVHELDAGDYRAWLEGGRVRLNTPSVLLRPGTTEGPTHGHEHPAAGPLLLRRRQGLRPPHGHRHPGRRPTRPWRERELHHPRGRHRDRAPGRRRLGGLARCHRHGDPGAGAARALSPERPGRLSPRGRRSSRGRRTAPGRRRPGWSRVRRAADAPRPAAPGRCRWSSRDRAPPARRRRRPAAGRASSTATCPATAAASGGAPAHPGAARGAGRPG